MANIAIFRINYKSDFILTLNSDAGWMTPFCIKFWTTGEPSRGYFVGWDGKDFINCKVDETDASRLIVLFDDHQLPVGQLKMQMAWHTTIADFPHARFDEVMNQMDVVATVEGEEKHVELAFEGESDPEVEYFLPAYINEAQRIENELQRQQNELVRQQAEVQREEASAAAVEGAENVNAQLNGTILTVTNREGESTSSNVQGPAGDDGKPGEGVPAGGTTGQILQKASDNDYDTEWSNPPVSDVTSVNGQTGDVTITAQDLGAYQKPAGGIPASDIANGVIPDVSNFVTASVNNLVNYYLKSETYTKEEVAALIGAIQQFHYEIYASTSDVTTPASNVLYLIGPASVSGGDKYEEYVYANNGFVKIGDTSIDLSGYVTTTALNNALANYTTTTDLTTLLDGKQDVINDLATIRSGASAGATAVQPSAIADMEVTTNKVTSLSSSSTNDQYPSAKAVVDYVGSEITKLGEIVTVTAIADSGSVEDSAVLKIKVNGDVVAEGTGTVTATISRGSEYTVEAERVYDYLTPAPQTFVASQPSRTVTMNYTYIQRDTITIDQTVTNEQSMISGNVQGDVIKAIRAASHLYLGKQTETGNQLICQLSDTDGTKYHDGTTAAMDGSEGDQWMKLPVFWWKVTPVGTPDADDTYDQYSFSFAFAGEPDPTWHKWEGDMNLLGAKKMYVTGGKGYSRSGIQGSANFTQAQGNSYAAARGTGYSCATWEWQWMMCILFYAWYGRMNSQAQCGSGSNSNARTLGTKDSLGMTDTTSSNGNADNTKFWGIENWWGDLSEWIGNITSMNYVVTIVDMNTKQSRQVSGWYPFGGAGGYASRFKVTDLLDFIPRAKNGTDTTCYCDWVNGNTGSRVVLRSYVNAYPNGGVAYVNSSSDPSVASANYGSRLAFNGVITEAESVAAYKAALA